YGTQGIPLSQGTVQLFLRTMQPFAQRYVASFSLDLTINDLFREIIISNLSDEELKKLNTLPPTLRNAFLERSAAEIRAGIGQYIDISNIDGNDKIPDAFYKFIVEKFAKSSRPLQTTIFSGAGILLFLMFRTAIWLLTLVASFVSFLIYEIMMVTGFARVSLETRSKEVVLMQ
ncbi:MAG: hypothetical protein HY456_02305, partial [Parcubacteria group bacterium]|nr:hypothetical protein [Parcubacteria group bacterium]